MTTDFKHKLIIYSGIVLILVALILIIKWQRDIIAKQTYIEGSLVTLKKLPDSVTRSESSYVSKDDLKTFAKDLDLKLGPIQNDLNKLGADVKTIGYIRVETKGKQENNIPSNKTEPKPATDPVDQNSANEYLKNTQVLKLNEPFSNNSVPFGDVKFSAWRTNPWDLNVYPRNYTVVNVLGEDENGRHYVYNKFSIDVNGKSYNLDIANAKMVEEYPPSSFRFSPKLTMGIDAGVYLTNPRFEFAPNLELFLFSKGRTKVLPTWMFAGVGVNYQMHDKSVGLVLSPVDYNMGDVLPVITNLYLGPSLSFDMKGNFALLGGLHVTL